jgi:lipopolysaccharide transport system ATP-binding protein
MSIIIKAENLSKAYQIGEFSTKTLTRDIERWWALSRGKEDPFSIIGEKNDRSVKGTSDIVWSLKDINFDIEEGEAVGIIGKNGAGKSTLLKILSQVTIPTSGSVKIKGKIASLLEVGTGFHPELTGRENIYTNGAILGMKKSEITKKLDEIIDFSGVERYIDTPVKRYSSGMYVRLAFAVAAHLESDILIVDEVLAVGDAEFQKKCISKMDYISKGNGRTILFVSHNMNSIQKLCSRGILLEDGGVKANDDINTILNLYSNLYKSDSDSDDLEIAEGINYTCKNGVEISAISLEKNILNQEQPLSFKIDLKSEDVINGLKVNLSIINSNDICVSSFVSYWLSESVINFNNQNKCIKIHFPNHRLMPGSYKIKFELKDNFGKFYEFQSQTYFFRILNDFFVVTPKPSLGSLYTPSAFTIE